MMNQVHSIRNRARPGRIALRWRQLVLVLVVTLMGAGPVAVTNVGANSQISGCWFPLSPTSRSILMIESKEAPVTTSAAVKLPPLAISQNWRSIMLIEGKEAPVATSDGTTAPALEISQSWRSILLIEGKEPPVEIAQSGC